jgi:hypothetical protein
LRPGDNGLIVVVRFSSVNIDYENERKPCDATLHLKLNVVKSV